MSDRIRQNINNLLAVIQEQKTIYGELKATLACRPHDAELSWLEKITAWYVEKAIWYERAGILALTTSCSAIAGLALGLAPVFTLTSLGLYFLATSLLKNHHDVTTEREKRLSDNISQNIIRLMTVLENHAKQLLLGFCDLVIQYNQQIEKSNQQIASLETENTAFQNTIDTLNQTNQTLLEQQDELTSQLNKALADLEQLTRKLQQQPSTIESITRLLEGSTNKILTDSQSLSNVINTLQDELKKLSDFENSSGKSKSEQEKTTKIVSDQLKKGEQFLFWMGSARGNTSGESQGSQFSFGR